MIVVRSRKRSRFICLKCLHENMLGDQMYRSRQREKGHIKDLTCICCGGEITKNLEVRWCDGFPESMEYAKEIRQKYYGKRSA